MEDVKKVVSGVLTAWYVAVGVLAALALGARAAGWWGSYRAGLQLGGWLTLGVAALAGVVGTLGAAGSGDVFWQFFSGFHGLFFTGDTWLFSYSDTLIRLYPLRLWQDAVLYIGILTAAGAGALAFGMREPRARGTSTR
jgi:hypothetical protein